MAGAIEDRGGRADPLALDAASHEPITVARQLAVLYGVARAFAEADQLRDAAPTLLRALTDALGWQAAALWVPHGEVLRCVAIHPTDGRLETWAADAMSRRFARDEGLPGRVWALGEGVWVRDTDSEANFSRRDVAKRVGLRHGFAFPVTVRGDVVAVVELFAAKVRDLDPSQSAFLDAVGHQLGGFIERVAARQQTAVSEARKAAILSAAVDGIVSADGEGRIFEFNAAAEQMFGLPRDAVIGRTVAEMLVPDEIVATHQAGMERYRTTREPHILGRRVRTWAKRADGSRLPVELTVTERLLDGAPMFTAFIRDITREREAETARERFLEILSHELRTPVTALYGGAMMLSRRELDEADRRSYLGEMAVEADRLYRMIEDLIVLARAERGALSLAREPVRLERVAERVLNQFREAAPALQLNLEVIGYAPPAAADETSVEQLMRNLVSNAVKYGAAGGRIDVQIKHVEDETQVRVMDRGVGIDPAEVNQLFEIDFRSPLSEGLAHGSGIGLFVARWLVQEMGGRIWAAPRDGGGSEFGFALPLLDGDEMGEVAADGDVLIG